MIDEGASTLVMSLSCWKALGSLELVPYATILKDFNGHQFKPHGIIDSFPIELGEKTSKIQVEVVNAPLTIIFC